MKGLWLQDYYLFKRQRLAAVITWLLATGCLFGFGSWGIEIGMSLFAIMLSMLTLTLLTANQQNHGLKFLLTLPVAKTTYVQQKYELLLGQVTFSILLMTGTACGLATLLDWRLTLTSIFQQAYLVGLLILALLLVLVPYQLKHGPTATQTFMSVIGALVAAIIGGGYLSVQRTSWGKTYFNDIVTAIAQHGPTNLLLVITGLIVLLLGYSYFRSLAAVKHLNF